MQQQTRTLAIHPAQTAILLERKREAEAAAHRFSDAVALVCAGAGVTNGELRAIDTDANTITIAVAGPVSDAPEGSDGKD